MRKSNNTSLVCLVALTLAFAVVCGFTISPNNSCRPSTGRFAPTPTPTAMCCCAPQRFGAYRTRTTSPDPAESLKEELIQLGHRTYRGFQATSVDRNKGERLVRKFTEINPTKEPARAYFEPNTLSRTSRDEEPSVSGQWTLIYTDAPDITSLRQGSNSFVELGRIGQNCNPPIIENVIDWKRPAWIPSFGPAYVLQKVVTAGVATENAVVYLTLNGIRAEADKDYPWLPPLDLGRGFVSLPFGRFKILYLDDDLRITRTGQNYLAVNQRVDPSKAWF